jgi:hypothetical protein
MAHNNQASGSHVRTMNLNTGEVRILAENKILVPPEWHLPQG